MTSTLFHGFPIWVLIGIFVLSSAVVWIAGGRLSRYASIISARTGIGQAVVGLVLLGGITSLPEVATSVTASWAGNAPLAVNNLLGGVAMQVAVLAVGDLFVGREALTGMLPRPHVVLQAALSVVLLVLVVAGIVVGDVMLLGFGAWPCSIAVGYGLTLWVARSAEGRVVWVVKEAEQRRREPRAAGGGDKTAKSDAEQQAMWRVVLKTAIAAGAILVAGYLLTRTGEAIAEVTGLGQSFFGAVFLAISTSLPELSSVITAVRLGHQMLAIGDVLGGNLFDVALIFVVDAIYAGPPVLNEVGSFSAFAALLGIAMTTFYVIGMIERRDRAIFRMGYDSVAVFACYIIGLVILYGLRQ